MPTCPLCGNAQEAPGACDVCGLPLPGAPHPADAGPPAPEALEGLEPTRLEAAGPSAPAPLPDLEPTGFPAGDPFLEVEPSPVDAAALDLDRGRAAPVDAGPERLPDLEPTSAPPVADAAAPPASPRACRYCRSPAEAAEPFCRVCGMRLVAPPGAPAAASAAGGEGEGARCGCGAPISGARCPACGARRAAP